MNNQVKNLEKMKLIKRRARASYNFLRTVYGNKLGIASDEERKLFSEVILAMDEMSRMYESLKRGMRRESLTKQIEFAEKWEKYISCVEVITARKTKDKYLLRETTTSRLDATEMALSLWFDFRDQFKAGD